MQRFEILRCLVPQMESKTSNILMKSFTMLLSGKELRTARPAPRKR